MNTKVLIAALAFAAGAVTGIFATKKYYRKKADEEIAFVRSVRKEMNERVEPPKPEPSPVEEYIVADIDAAKQMVQDLGYTRMEKRPYLIGRDEFAVNPEYEAITWACYEDGTVVDENWEVVENADRVIGVDPLAHFGYDPSDPDTIYVRNDEIKCDFEILKELGPFGI